MVIKVGINGFGRIGRVIFRTCLQNPDIELSAINDPAIDIEYICYLIKFDSTHGKFKGNVTHTEDQIHIDDKLIKVFRDKLPHTVPWQVAGVQYVIEASGMFTCLEKSSGHLASDCVKRVIVTAPSADVPMIILGVNDHKLNTEQKVLSCASSTLYCLAPIVKVLEENYGVSEGFITSIHAMTPSLKPLDGLCLRGKHWRDHRSIHQNIIPASTGSCNALAKIIPQVKDKMTGLAFRVPIVNVSVLDMTVRLNTNTSLQHIIKSVEKASKTFLQNIIKISNDEAVSSDFSGDSHSCILDADCSLQLKPDFYKIICWYENEYSYACRVLDSIFFSERQFNKPSVKLPCKMTYVRPKVMKKQDEVQQTEAKIKDTLSTDCNTEVPKISSFQESAFKRKPFVRPVVLRKPLSTHNPAAATLAAVTLPAANRDTKKRNELFKIWNDNNDAQKNAARQKRSSFFHSCISFVPKVTENIDCKNAQERLENVKREFNKMVNITEDLLKKSNSSKSQPGTTTNSPLQEIKLGARLEGVLKVAQTIVKANDQPAKDSIFDICGDYKNRTATEFSSEEVRCSSSNERNENQSDYNISSTVKKVDSIKKSNLVPQEKAMSFSRQNSVTNIAQKFTAQAKLLGNTNEMLKKNLNSPSKSRVSLVQCAMEQKEMSPKFSNKVFKEKEEENRAQKKVEEIKIQKKLEENKVEKKLEENKVEKKLEENKVQKKVEENKVQKNLEENKVQKKLEENKVQKKLEENKVQKKVEENKVQKNLEDNKVQKKLEENKVQKNLEDNKFQKKFEENKVQKKLEENKFQKKLEENKVQKKFEENKVQKNLEENKVQKNLEENKVQKKLEENKVQITEGIPQQEHQQGRALQVPAEITVCKSAESDSFEKLPQRVLNKFLHKKNHSMHVIDEELQKRNIVLVNDQDQNNTEMNLKSCNTINEQLITETNKRRQNLSKHILECLNRKPTVPVVIVPQDSAECNPGGATAASSNGNGIITKPDLYDKLDSASATDSNNSFEITERKSQVIHITDLTNSLDDLARLDKICRIIEISDELSDKLFSSLDQTDLTVQQKNWSFRDLCERIQLDEFCNKVFGHSRS